MKSESRRRYLESLAVLFGASAGCQAFNQDDGTPSADAGQEANAADRLFVEQSVSELPQPGDGPAFGVTYDGVFRYEEGGWNQINLGTVGNPVPRLFADSVYVGYDPIARPLISNRNVTVYVDPNNGNDSATGSEDAPLATIQEAVSRAPIYLRDQYTVDLGTVPEMPVSYDEDVLVPSIIGTGMAAHEDGAAEPGPTTNLVLRGEQNNPDAVDIGSLMFANVVGVSAGNLFYATISRDSPYDEEEVGLSSYGAGEVHLYDVNFTDGVSNAILAYGSKMKATQVNFGDHNVNIGVRGKRHASIQVVDSTGQTQGPTFMATENSLIGISEGNEATGNPTTETWPGGLIHHPDDNRWIGIPDDNHQSTNVGTGSGHPDDADRGDVWYVDGGGEPEEGFWGQTENGPVKLS